MAASATPGGASAPTAAHAANFGDFGELSPLLAPRSIAVIGASDREGNLGGAAVGFLRKFGYPGPVWPVNSARTVVAGLPCYASLRELPSAPDLAILAVPAEAAVGVLRESAAAGVRAAVIWAGGFAERGDNGRALQNELVDICRTSGIKLCGPNCIGIINTSIGLTASFSSMLYDHDHLTPGAVSMVSQSGGISVMSHSRAQLAGLGFRVTVSCGNEAALGIPDFIRALAQDEGTRVIAVYTEGLSNPAAFVAALDEARRRRKPVVMLKGGATEASGRAALAHTGRLAGFDRTYDAIFREFAVIRVYSSEEMLDVSLQLASMRPGQLPAGDRVLLSSFGGGSGVICTDQCVREGLAVPQLDADTMAKLMPLLTPLSSALNPIDLTPGMMTNPQNRARLPAALQVLSDAPNLDAWLFMAAGFDRLVPELVAMVEHLRKHSPKPIFLTWQSPPEGTIETLSARGFNVFNEHARAARALGHIVRYAKNLQHRIRQVALSAEAFPWSDFVDIGDQVIPEHVVARILEAAKLPVARGRMAATAEDADRAAREVGFPVAIKGISPAITHRAAAGLVALNLDTSEAVANTERAFRARAAACGVTLDGVWVQHMFRGERELLVTALRDQEFGVILGCGMGGAMTEIIDDVVFARAPLDADGAFDLLGTLRSVRRLPEVLPEDQRRQAAEFIARFSALVATAPWGDFTFEVNPLKLGSGELAAVDGLLLIG